MAAGTQSYARSWALAECSLRFDSYAWMRVLTLAICFALCAASIEPMGFCLLALSNCSRCSLYGELLKKLHCRLLSFCF